MISSNQCTIIWYVDYNMISHMDSKVINGIIEKIEVHFGKMTVTRGEKYIFVGMDKFYPEDNRVKIYMKDFIKECFDTSKEDLSKDTITSATKSLFGNDK